MEDGRTNGSWIFLGAATGIPLLKVRGSLDSSGRCMMGGLFGMPPLHHLLSTCMDGSRLPDLCHPVQISSTSPGGCYLVVAPYIMYYRLVHY